MKTCGNSFDHNRKITFKIFYLLFILYYLIYQRFYKTALVRKNPEM